MHPKDFSFQYSLSDPAERAKRNLMLFASLCVFLAFARELPTRIPLLGIELDSAHNQEITVIALFSVQLYLFFRFLVLVGVDLRNWLFNAAVTKSKDLGLEEFASVHSLSAQAEVYRIHRFASAISRLSSLSRFYELVLPVLYGLLGLSSAISLFWVIEPIPLTNG
jgi:hypothetical protein